MYESRYATREDIDAAMRLGCGYPMGPLALMDLIGLDTAYEILDTMYKQGRDRLHAPSPVIKQMVSAGLKGRKSGRGFYTYAEPGRSQVVADAPDPAARRRAAVASGRSPRSASSARARWRPASSRSSPRPATTWSTSPAPTPRSTACARRVTKSLDKAVQRGKLTEEDRDAALAQITGTTSLDDLRDVDIVVEAVVEDLAVKQALFENLDEICKPGAILATTTSRLPVVECAAATKRPQDVVGHALLQPRPGDEAGRGRVHRLDGRRRRRDRAGPLRQDRQARR